jgi:hypothetical protein
MKYSLGIDASTTTIGICLLSSEKKIIKISHLDLSDVDSHYEMTDIFKKELLEYKKLEIIPNKIIIEAAIKSMHTSSSTNTLITLHRFNSLVGYICYDVYRDTESQLGKNPIFVDSRTARAAQKIVIPQIPDEVSDYDRKKMIKGIMIDFCLSEQSSEELGFKKTSHDNWAIWCGDRADSYILAKYGLK